MEPVWAGVLVLASVFVPGCGGEAPDSPILEPEVCAPALPGDAEDKGMLLPRYMGRRTNNSPCYGVPESHICVGLPWTKAFTWSYSTLTGDRPADYFAQMTARHWDGVSGFEEALLYQNQLSGYTGYSIVYDNTPPDPAAHITISWTWGPDSGWGGSAGCTVPHHTVTTNAPEQVTTVTVYKGCYIDFNVARTPVYVDAWAGQPGYDITDRDYGWAIGQHELGHIFGLAHAKAGLMKGTIPAVNIDNPDFTGPTYDALWFYNPNWYDPNDFFLQTIPGYTPHISE